MSSNVSPLARRFLNSKVFSCSDASLRPANFGSRSLMRRTMGHIFFNSCSVLFPSSFCISLLNTYPRPPIYTICNLLCDIISIIHYTVIGSYFATISKGFKEIKNPSLRDSLFSPYTIAHEYAKIVLLFIYCYTA